MAAEVVRRAGSASARTLICGSLALDTIMVFPDRFARHILPEQAHVLSVSFQIGEMRREWGGTAGNIAYNLKALGGDPVVMATLGDDGQTYVERMRTLGIGTEGVRIVPGTYTGQAFIITDLDDNQITAFHPGAMNESHRNRVADVGDIALGIVAPDGRQGMYEHVRDLDGAGIPFIFDPGQGLPLFSGPELVEMIDRAEYVAVNDYEGQMLCERTGLALEAIAERVQALIVTKGGDGSRIYAAGAVIDIPAVEPAGLVDPTGCGDAYRAGLLFGIARSWSWERTGRLASLLGSIKIASRGGQNHSLERAALAARYAAVFGEPLF
ncbi:MAG TPA: carbohydrate kinase family protein [Stellaceae bacterium]|jgi:adenosine kinase|nr:carbohydrate kinase family protein [Stellaceae bacterium]